MRKVRQEIEGIISFKKDESVLKSEISNLGATLNPAIKKGLMNSNVVNNHMTLIDMQQNGLKLENTFHYNTSTEKKNKTNEYIDKCNQNIKNYLENNYKATEVECFLKVKDVYDEDYCSLPIEEAKNDLTHVEFIQVLKEAEIYKPTTLNTRKKRNVFFD